MLEQQRYLQVRDQIQPGDLIAFGGNSPFSRWAKLTTRSVVTHVAIVMQTQRRDDVSPQCVNLVMEATVYEGRRGVMTNRLSERVIKYDGDIWWLPLSLRARQRFEQNKAAFFEFMLSQQDKNYDVLQLFGAAIDCLDDHPLFSALSYNHEDFSSWFCSELIAEGLEQAGVVSGLNASEVTPIDLCRFAIFQNQYVQLKGEAKPISGFNSQTPDNWGHIA